MSVTEAGKVSADFDYHPDGQIASVTYADGRRENCLWDGLALIHRDGTELLNEPAVTGGNPVFGSESGVMFNDMLGTTLGIKGNDFTRTNLTAFGENLDAGDKAFFTGKPLVGELGYAFLFRNYRPEQGKWQTADPLGYPDGWNNFAYVNNNILKQYDSLGLTGDEWSYDVAITRGYIPQLGEIQVLILDNGYHYKVSKNWRALLKESHGTVHIACQAVNPCPDGHIINSWVEESYTDWFVAGFDHYVEEPYSDAQLNILITDWDAMLTDSILESLNEWSKADYKIDENGNRVPALFKTYTFKCQNE